MKFLADKFSYTLFSKQALIGDFFYLKRELRITDKAPKPGEDGINKLQHGKKGNQIGRNVGHQFNGGRGTSSSGFQDVSLFPINYSGHI